MLRIKKMNTLFQYAVLGIGLAFIGLLLIPIGILAVLTYLIWSITDRIIAWCEKGGRNGI